MKRTTRSVLIALGSLVIIPFLSSYAVAQKDKKEVPTSLMTRSTTRHETARLAYGATVTISGAPLGSISIEGWERSEMDVTAMIELQAPTAADLDRLALINSFVIDQDANHIRILTTGTHDREFMKRAAKNFPKNLIGLPWKIDFHIKVPASTDLEIDAGTGPIMLSGVEGALRLNAMSSVANLWLTGGIVSVLIQQGTLNLRIPSRGWRGLGAEFKVAAGNLNIELVPGFSADVNASVLRFGQIKNSFQDLRPREGGPATDRLLRARAGSGGATLEFTVGDGTIEIKPEAKGQ